MDIKDIWDREELYPYQEYARNISFSSEHLKEMVGLRHLLKPVLVAQPLFVPVEKREQIFHECMGFPIQDGMSHVASLFGGKTAYELLSIGWERGVHFRDLALEMDREVIINEVFNDKHRPLRVLRRMLSFK